ncbi:regulatory LuxR family protein [Lutibacter sp. Hel_I_33_5]|uniref:7TM diverse intracellular signaling domain-containing protein n=1 Tax=Lutibacter sp. Hel_I_33_5 TaxID=1566289 RepID=UPI00119D2F19|nr:7TM diverse intracellular signaling domain-containing protein [Lutibacter sp. Hel_I_33_5]TVZ56252.1 regulatory LuxR family protein [Lutibacter sp. Hel_I_33_5]
MILLLSSKLMNIKYALSVSLTYQSTEPVSNFESSTHVPSLFIGIFFGSMLVMAIYNLLLYFSLKDKMYLFYVGIVLFNILTILAIHGISGEFFWSNNPELDRTIYITFAGISMFFSSRFAALYLDLKNRHKSLNKFMWGLAILSVLLSISSLLLSDKFVIPFGRWLVLLSFPSYIIVAAYAHKKGFKAAKYYLIAWIPYAIGLIIRTMHGADWLPTNQFVLSSIEIGGALEIVLLSLALAYRIKEIQEENSQMRNQLQNYISQVLSLEEKIDSSAKSDENLPEQKIAKIAQKHSLTERETDILLQIVLGLKNQQIADKLFISINTVKYHTRNIYEKLDVQKRTEITSRILFDN